MGEWWETFFDDTWLKGGFGLITRGRTLSDVRFIQKVLGLRQGARVLDVCCGVGRHSIERIYSPHELIDLMGRAGFRLNALFGDRRARAPTWEHRMTAVLARKG